MSSWLVAIGLALAWLVPIHFPPWVSWHGELIAFATVFLGAAYGVFRCGRQIPQATLPWTRLNALWLGLAAVVFLQALTGRIAFAGDAVILALYLALALTASWAGTVFAQRTASLPATLDILAWALLASAMLTSLIAFVQVLDVWPAQEWIARMPHLRRPGGNLAQPNQMATLLLMGLASLVYLHERQSLRAALAVLCAVILCAGAAISESRTGALNILLLASWLVVGRFRCGFRLTWAPVLSLIACYTAFLLAWPSMYTFLQGEPTTAQVDVSGGLRLVVWPQLLAATMLHPWLGWGVREVSEAQNAVAHHYSLSEAYTYSHNILLDLVLGVGWPMAILLVSLCVVWTWRRAHAIRDITGWYAMALVLPVALHSMLEFPYAYAYFLAPVAFALGILDASARQGDRRQVKCGVAGAGLAICIAVGAVTVIEYVQIEEDFRVVRFEDMHVGTTPESYERPTIHLLTQLAGLLEAGRLEPAPGMQADQIELARRVANRFPWPATQRRYALSLALNGQPEEARRQLLVIRALHGDKSYQSVKRLWLEQAEKKYPQLAAIPLP